MNHINKYLECIRSDSPRDICVQKDLPTNNIFGVIEKEYEEKAKVEVNKIDPPNQEEPTRIETHEDQLEVVEKNPKPRSLHSTKSSYISVSNNVKASTLVVLTPSLLQVILSHPIKWL